MSDIEDIERLRTDAERYRWLRDRRPTICAVHVLHADNDYEELWSALRGEEMDRVVDAAINNTPTE
jgi:protease II